MSWKEPVTDRTKEEADYAARLNAKGDYDYLNDYFGYLGEGMDAPPLGTDQEIRDWDAGLKGSLAEEDLDRIEGDVATLLAEFDLSGTTYEGNIPMVPQEAYYRNLLKNVGAIREAYHTSQTPEVPQEPLNTYGKWNDIETILKQAYEYQQNRYLPHCGDIYCGENGLLI